MCTARVCLAPRSVTSIITKEKRKRQVRKLNNYISNIWCYSGLFYSRSTLERVSSFLKKILQTINLAGSCWVSLFPELLLSALHSVNLYSILGSICLKTTVNLQNYINQSCSMTKNCLTCKNTLTNAVVSWVMYTWNLRLTRKNALISAVVSWVVYTWNPQLTCKNALIIPVVSWVVYTWKLQLTCKDTLINAVVSRLMHT